MDKQSSIYKKVKKEADEKFKNHGIYKSAWIVREYKERGGKFKEDKPSKKQGLQRWFNEEWVRIGKDGKPTKKPCGRSSEEMDKKVKKGLCRPVKRITKETPKTAKELGSKVLKDRYKRKKKNPNKTII
jgi:hypothetical protein